MKSHGEVMRVFAARLKASIRQSGWTVTEVANRVCTNPATVYYYLRQKRLPGAHTLCLLAELLGVSTDWLLGIDEEDDE